ncbi:hypothetical protein ACLOJK_029329 [Asimina triloba]
MRYLLQGSKRMTGQRLEQARLSQGRNQIARRTTRVGEGSEEGEQSIHIRRPERGGRPQHRRHEDDLSMRHWRGECDVGKRGGRSKQARMRPDRNPQVESYANEEGLYLLHA